MISLYFLLEGSGRCLSDVEDMNGSVLPRYSQNWTDARFYVGVQGLLRLRHIMDCIGGTIMIVNAEKPQRYCDQ